ncbi:MAG: hypothetical protein EOO46_11120 [Flavobacterium sp.]|nr:MAG: hypothetical protein EOO46_11120 [Flavobacterium sp.]
MFNGTVAGWKRLFHIKMDDDLEYLVIFMKELNSIAESIRPHNEELYEICRKSKESKQNQESIAVSTDANEAVEPASKRQRIKSNVLGSLLATFLQTYELMIVNIALDMLIDETTLTKVEEKTLVLGKL